jgi:pyruvate dehydrogenase E2 component (dihydrolipoamide acetyltransferase)
MLGRRLSNLLIKPIARNFALREITMPAVSPTMTEGKILEYTVKPGDFVEEGDSIATIETDKANMSLDIQEEGYVARIVKDAGSGAIKVGELIVYMVDDEHEVAQIDKLISEESSSSKQIFFKQKIEF